MSEESPQIVFALAKNDQDVDVLILGVPQDAADYMKDGKTHTLDLTKIGVPIQVIMFGAETKEKCLELIQQGNTMCQALDMTDKPMGIDIPKTH